MTAARTGTSHLAVPQSLQEVARLQCAVLTRAQLAATGFGPDRVAARGAARRWQLIGRRVVVLHNAPLSEQQRRWASVLMLEQPVALAGLTAAAAAGLEHFTDDRTHIVVARACDVTFPSWVRVHNSRRFSEADVDQSSRLPRTRVARALIDAAAWSRSPRRGCAILCAGVQQRLTRPDILLAELRVAGAVRHAALLRSVLGDISGGGHTLDEIALGPLARRAGLPAPRRQALRRERSGKVRYVDAEFDLPDRTTLTVEIDGAVHLRPLTWWDDLDRQNELAIVGGPLLRFDSVTIRLEPARVVDRLRRMYQAHGGR